MCTYKAIFHWCFVNAISYMRFFICIVWNWLEVLQNILQIRPNAKTVPLSSRRFTNELTLQDAKYHCVMALLLVIGCLYASHSKPHTTYYCRGNDWTLKTIQKYYIFVSLFKHTGYWCKLEPQSYSKLEKIF